MKRIFAKLILKFLGWRITGNNIFPKKCVIVVAPHTSNWDFIYGKCYAYALGIQPKYLVKSELYFWPISWFINHNGGIPVDRTQSTSLVDQLSLKIKNEDEFMLTLSPEGTRSKVDKWRTGFYYVAKKANIPMMPNVVGESSTKKQILFYSFLLLISSLSPFILGLTGYIYFFGSFTMSLGFCFLSIGLIIFPNRKLEIPLFVYSIFYLFGIFVFLVIDKYFVV